MKNYFYYIFNLICLGIMIKSECYGSWKSPITTDLIVENAVKLFNIVADGEDIYLLEGRPKEKGRSTILKFENSNFEEILPKSFNARTKVHEYGGLSFNVVDKEIYFSNFDDQKIYKIDIRGNIIPVTSISTDRYAEYKIDKKRDLIFCVQEEHLDNEVNNSIVTIDKKGKIKKIAKGNDFYSSLALSPDNKKLAFLSWNQPDMPWNI